MISQVDSRPEVLRNHAASMCQTFSAFYETYNRRL